MLVYMMLFELVEQGSKSVAFGSYADTRERNCLPRSRPRAFRCYYGLMNQLHPRSAFSILLPINTDFRVSCLSCVRDLLQLCSHKWYHLLGVP